MPNKNVNVIRPDGSVTSLPIEQAERLKTLGYKIESDEEASLRSAEKITKEHYDTTGQKVQAGVEGVISGASMGLSDLSDGIEERGRAAAHPGTRLAGEVVGAILPDLLTAGAAAPESVASIGATGARVLAKEGVEEGAGTVIRSGIKEAVGYTPAGLASRARTGIEESVGGVKGAIAGNAVQGALQGAGASITNAKLSGDDVTVESVLAGAGMGGLVGGVVGGAAHGLGTVASKAASKGESTAVDEAIDSLIKDQNEETLNAHFADAHNAEKAVNSLVEEGRDAHFTNVHQAVRESVSNINTAVSGVESELDAAIKNIGSTAEGVKIPKLTNDAITILDSVDSIGAPSKITGTIKKVARENGINLAADETGESFVAKLRAKADHIESLKSAGVAGNSPEAAALAQAKGVLNAKTAEEAEERLSNYKILKATNFPADVSRAVSKVEELFKLKKSAELLKDFPDSIAEFRKMKGSRLENMVAALEAVGKRPEFAAIDSSLSASLEEFGIKATGTPAEKARMLWETKNLPITPETEKLKVRMPKDETTLANRKASSFWSRAFKQVGARGTSSVARKLGLGFIGGGVGYELGGNLSSGLVGASMFSGVAGMRESVVGSIRSAAAKWIPRTATAAKVLAPRVGGLAIRIDGTADTEKNRIKQFKNRIAEIEAVGPGFADSAFQIVEPLVGHQDEFASGFHRAALRPFQALSKYLPRDPGVAFAKGKSLWTPTDGQLRIASKILAAYHDPVGTFTRMLSSGDLDTITVNFMKDAFPGLYGEFQSAMIQRISQNGVLDSMDEHDQAHVGILIGMPLHSSHSPRSIAYTQTMYQKVAEAAVANKPKSSGTGGGSGGRPAKSEPPTPAQSLIQIG